MSSDKPIITAAARTFTCEVLSRLAPLRARYPKLIVASASCAEVVPTDVTTIMQFPAPQRVPATLACTVNLAPNTPAASV